MKKVIYCSSYRAAYQEKDFQELSKLYECNYLQPKKNYKRNILAEITKIFYAIEKSDVCVIFFLDFFGYICYYIAEFLKVKTLVIVGGYEVENIPEIGYGSSMKFWHGYLLRRILIDAKELIAPSNYSRKKINQFIGRSREIHKIGFDFKSQNILRSDEKKKQIVTVGNYVPVQAVVKGLDHFIEVSKSFPDYNFLIFGKIDENFLHLNHKNLPANLKFMNKQPNDILCKYLAESEIFCQLSIVESFGVAVLEAIESGCKLVLTKNGALPEFAGTEIDYAEYGNIESIKSCIKQAIKSTYSSEMLTNLEKKFKPGQRIRLLKEVIDG
jgi:glycosyltransferase involved in cell wall biosynthesis